MQLRFLAVLAMLIGVGACSKPPPDANSLPSKNLATEQQRLIMEVEEPTPVIRIPVAPGTLVLKSLREPVPAAIASRPIRLQFPADSADVANLAAILSYLGIPVAFRWKNATGEEMLKRRLPFTTFSGRLEELLATLRAGTGLVSWYQDGTLFLADLDRFAFTVPQNKDVVDAIAGDLKSLGAQDITPSLRGGQIVYSAPPSLQDEVLHPYFERIKRNMAMVKVQLAVVTLILNDSAANGFNWNVFGAEYRSGQNRLTLGQANPAGTVTTPQTASTTTTGTSTSTTGTTGTTTTTAPSTTTTAGTIGTLTGLGGTAINLAGTTFAGVFGNFSVAGAIAFLSEFGRADTRQNVEVRTLSGTPVVLRSGQKIPYVSGVGVNTIAATSPTLSSGLLGSAQTATVDTGLSIKLTPLFDADNEIVTVELDVSLKSILEFRELSAGNQVGTFTQPVTQEQSLNDTVRVIAGNTVVIGGLQTDSTSYRGNEPTFLRDTSLEVGLRAKQTNKEALFVIIRPAVTVFEEQPGSGAKP